MPVSATLSPPAHHDRPRVGTRRREPRDPIAPREEGTPSRLRAPLAEGGEVVTASDEMLLGRYRDARRPEDFVELLRRYSGELSRYLSRYLGDAALAEDVLQDTFLLVHTKCGLYRDGWPARPWLYSVAIHRAVDALRRSRRLPTTRLDGPSSADEAAEPGSLLEMLAGAEPGPLEELQERERQCWVRECLSRLPEPMRQVLVLAYFQELSYSEVAELLGLPLGTVKSRLHVALARLRAMAERHDRAGSR